VSIPIRWWERTHEVKSPHIKGLKWQRIVHRNFLSLTNITHCPLAFVTRFYKFSNIFKQIRSIKTTLQYLGSSSHTCVMNLIST
jgi:hypothetical protein